VEGVQDEKYKITCRWEMPLPAPDKYVPFRMAGVIHLSKRVVTSISPIERPITFPLTLTMKYTVSFSK
jgi:hypothetical protein